jgi:hypothetical protein
MTTTDRIHEQSFRYDQQVPPSVPAGEPLRGGRGETAAHTAPRGIRRTLTALRGRIRPGE